MKALIKIGLTYTGSDEKHNNYVNWLVGSDAVEIVILTGDKIEPEDIHNLDGIVLSGGVDVHPGFYKSSVTDYPNRPADFKPGRDAFEKTVFEVSQQFSIPLLGICRGLQLVNCLTGGTLVQDLGPSLNEVHRFDKTDKKHTVIIEAGSLLHEIIGTSTTEVNSAHHQAIDKLGKDLKVSARAADGTIEGIEWEDSTGKPFFLAIQWHPERMEHVGLTNAPASINIRNRFINEVQKNT
jgi:putative glutamine amidotransferase